MNKIDFSDINKFFTSLGLILIGLALLLPWYINKNLNILLIEEKNLNNLVPTAKKIIIEQQIFLNTLNKFLPYIMGCLIIGGIALIIIGLCNWKKRQKVIYGIQDEEWRLKKQEGISKEEKKEIISHEIAYDNKIEKNEDKQNAIQDYISLENSIYLKLSRYFAVNYIVEQNIRVDKYNFDIILKSKFINKRVDLILEIKYFKRKIDFTKLQVLIQTYLLSIAHYEQTMQRPKVIPVFIIVLESDQIIDNFEEMKIKLKDYGTKHGINNLRIIKLLKSEIETIDAKTFVTE